MRWATWLAASLAVAGGSATAETHLSRYMDVIETCLLTSDDTRQCIGIGSQTCSQVEEGGFSTQGMVGCMIAERDAWDSLLNAEYQQARGFAQALDVRDRADAPEYAIRAGQLRDAQRAWIPFRDANCRMEAGAWGQGTFAQVLMAECLMRMTGERALDLRRHRIWLQGETN